MVRLLSGWYIKMIVTNDNTSKLELGTKAYRVKMSPKNMVCHLSCHCTTSFASALSPAYDPFFSYDTVLTAKDF